jgi:hypothetical protein
MITCKLIGRTANQMFQIAACIAYSKRTGMAYGIPRKSINEALWPASFHHFPDAPTSLNYFDYKEPGFDYHQIPVLQLPSHIRIEGYFQSELYFRDYRQDIINAFQIPWKPLTGYVSLHIRRGDYLQYADKHPPCSIEYITSAVQHFLDLGYSEFVVCSDDIKWCRVQLKTLEVLGANFSYSTEKEPIADLALMSCCEHNIIANSSFSWWAAWLNQNTEKVAIAPKFWFGPGNAHLNTSTLIPEGWITI